MSTNTGKQAEDSVCTFLRARNYDILANNWRTRWCEIDIIVHKQNVVYFVEVKYRQNNRHGVGLDYITSKKLQQMHFAAEMWMHMHSQLTAEYRLAAAEVSGSDFTVTAWIDDV